jgi:hypothetical protein
MDKLPDAEVPPVSIDAVAVVRGMDAGATTTDPRDARIAQLAAELASNPIQVRKARFEKRLHEGRLTYAEWKALPKDLQRTYAQYNGAPRPESESRRLANLKQRKREKNKCAKKSRQRNRG